MNHIISATEFAARFAIGMRDNQQPFTWFLGAGCSKSSGILDAGGLVLKWLSEQYKLQAADNNFDDWIKSEFPKYDATNPARSYAEVFERRHPSPVERQREIEMICMRGEPAYGYATLAQLISHKDYGRHCNTVLTTNFDDLIADALYLYGERHARPLVVTHEALARYVRTNSPRPTIVKLHGDAHLDPKNLQPETRKIDDSLSKQLYPFLQDHALVFVGYGGNDESILSFVSSCPTAALAPPIFWVSKQDAPGRFNDWLSERKAVRVDHTDFDQLMHLIRNSLSIDLIDRKRWNQIGDVYYEAFQQLAEEINKLAVASDASLALKNATSAAQKTLSNDWYYISKAEPLEELNQEAANQTYSEGLQKFPNSAILHRNYADFLAKYRKDFDSAERHFTLALEADPTAHVALALYARFQQTIRKDFDAAEKLFKRAIESNPNNSYSHTAYARFLEDERKDVDQAQAYYKRAIEIAPNYPYALSMYANFLVDKRNDIDAADANYRRAIEVDPNYVYGLTVYAQFQWLNKKDLDGAENFFKRAIEVDPNYVYGLESYARFLESVRNDKASAKTYRDRAKQAGTAKQHFVA